VPSFTENRRLLDLANDLHEATSLKALGEAFRSGIAPLVPGDLHEIFVCGSGAPEDDVWLGSPGGYSPDERAVLLSYLNATPEQHPVLEGYERHGDTGPRRVSEFLSVRAWRRREFYELFNRRWRHDYEAAMLLDDVVPNGLAGIAVVRGTSDITDGELEVLRLLKRPLEGSLRRLLDDRRRRKMLETLALTPEQVAAACPELTPRESEVLCWLSEGKSDPEIGRILGMSSLTAATHVGRILRKLRVDNRTAAALLAIRRALAGLL